MAYLLNCGALKSSVYTIGDYVIEWHLNSNVGDIVITTGVGTDPIIQAQHPVVNEVVPSGTLYPVLKYAYIDGEKYTSFYEEGSSWSPDFLTCLAPVVIDSINCDTLLNADADYNYILTYNNVNDIGQDKSRTFNYVINETSDLLAVKMYSSQVVDQFKFFYCTAVDPVGTLMDNFMIGSITDAIPQNYPTEPRTINEQFFDCKYIIDLRPFTYQAGNYVRIEIIGSVLDPTNTNTNWRIGLKCLNESVINQVFGPEGAGVLDVASMTDMTESGCGYLLTPKIVEPLYSISQSFALRYMNIKKRLESNILKDINGNGGGGSTSTSDYTDNFNSISMPFSVSYWPTYGFYGCENITGRTMTSVIENQILSVTFSGRSDYLAFKQTIADIFASDNYQVWLTRPVTDYRYYEHLVFRHYYTPSTCGDVYNEYTIAISLLTQITYDDVNYNVQFTLPELINQCTSTNDSCNNQYSQAEYVCSQVNNSRISVIPVDKQTTATVMPPIIAHAVSYIFQNTSILREHKMYYEIERQLLCPTVLDIETLFNFYIAGYDNMLMRKTMFNIRLELQQYETSAERLCSWLLTESAIATTGDLVDMYNFSDAMMGSCAVPTGEWQEVLRFTTTRTTLGISNVSVVANGDIMKFDFGDGFISYSTSLPNHTYADNSLKTVIIYSRSPLSTVSVNGSDIVFTDNTLDISGSLFNSLYYFSLINSSITVVNFPAFNNISTFTVRGTNIVSLDLSSTVNVNDLYLTLQYNSNLTTLILPTSVNGNISNITIQDNNVFTGNIDISGFKEYTKPEYNDEIYMYYRGYSNTIRPTIILPTTIDIITVPVSLDISNCIITNTDLSVYGNYMKSITIQSCNITSMTVSSSRFNRLYIYNSPIVTIDLSLSTFDNLVTGSTISLANCDYLTTFTMPTAESVNFSSISLQWLPALTSVIDLSKLTGWGSNGQISIYDCPVAAGLILPTMLTGGLSYFSVYHVHMLTSIDALGLKFSDQYNISVTGNDDLESLILPLDLSLNMSSFLFYNNGSYTNYLGFPTPIGNINNLYIDVKNAVWSIENNNRFLVELDQDAVSGYTNRTVKILAIDSTSGGYDGIAAQASLQSKGFNVSS